MSHPAGTVTIDRSRSPEPSSLSLLCWLAARGAAVCAVLGFVLLVSVAVTPAGRIAAIALLGAGAWPVLLTQAWVRRDRRWLRGGVACGLLVLVLVGELVRRAPPGDTGIGGRVSAVHSGSVGSFRRLSPANLVPEVDQLMCCFTVMALVDPLFGWRQSAELKSWTAQLYSELEGDSAFARLPSAMPSVYGELLGMSPQPGHAWVYIPPGLNRTMPAPVLVFFHGSGGNFKGYLWVLSKVADRLGMVLVSPSFGAGNWRLPQAEAAFDFALQAAAKSTTIESKNIHVVGLSNGGLAVSQLASVRGAQLRSVIFLSPVFDGERLGSAGFALQCMAKPVLVLTGAEDDRVPLGYVESAVAILAGAGAIPTLEVVPGANHFLLFSHRDRAVGALGDWLAANGVSAW